jgi:YD repeat-containing protein
VKGDGLESMVRYDATDPEAPGISGFPTAPATLGSNAGRVASVSDRGSKTIYHYDDRGQPRAIARKIAKPGAPADVLADRYTPHWYPEWTSIRAVTPSRARL